MKDKYKFLFEDFTFTAAADYLKEKMPYTRKAYKVFGEKHRRGAFAIAGYAKADIIAQIYNSLIDAIESGDTMEDFRKKINIYLEDNGYDGVSAFRADNIFRTNIQTAYQVGHYEAMTQPEVKKLRPYWMYDAVGDSRTRPSHMAMNGKVYPADSPVWDAWYPPNGYRCRCTVVTLSERQMEARGLTVSDKVPSTARVRGRNQPVTIDSGFAYNPAKREWRPDMGGMPKAIREAYLEQKRD